MFRFANRQVNRTAFFQASRRSLRDNVRRRGTAATELAVCLPMLTLVVFGSIQACNLIYLKHGVVTAAYEGTLELAKKDATTESVKARAQQVLDARGVTSSTIRVTPAGTAVEDASVGDILTIEVSANVLPNLPLTRFFPTPSTVTGRVVGTR